jgi:hypothetical protein
LGQMPLGRTIAMFGRMMAEPVVQLTPGLDLQLGTDCLSCFNQ